MPAEFVPVNPNMPPDVEEAFRILLKPVADNSRSRLTMDDIMGDIRSGLVRAWAVMEDDEMQSVVCTRVLDYRSGLRVFRIDYAAGRLPDVSQFLPQIMDLAREVQAHRIRIEGRSGWKKIFPDWAHVATIIEKEIDYAGWR